MQAATASAQNNQKDSVNEKVSAAIKHINISQLNSWELPGNGASNVIFTNNHTCLTSSDDGYVYEWNFRTKNIEFKYGPFRCRTTWMVSSRTGQYVAIPCDSNILIYQHKADSPRCKINLNGSDSHPLIIFSEDEKLLLIKSKRELLIYEIETEQMSILQDDSFFEFLDASKNLDSIFSIDAPGLGVIWKLLIDERKIIAIDTVIENLSFSMGSFVSVSKDWENLFYVDGQLLPYGCIYHLTDGSTSSNAACCLDEESDNLFYTSFAKILRHKPYAIMVQKTTEEFAIWDLPNCTKLYGGTIESENEDLSTHVSSLAISDDDKFIATIHGGKTIRIWQLDLE
jgi:WD40 repeat protein